MLETGVQRKADINTYGGTQNKYHKLPKNKEAH